MIQEVFVPRDDSKDEHLIHRKIIFKYTIRYIKLCNATLDSDVSFTNISFGAFVTTDI